MSLSNTFYIKRMKRNNEWKNEQWGKRRRVLSINKNWNNSTYGAGWNQSCEKITGIANNSGVVVHFYGNEWLLRHCDCFYSKAVMYSQWQGLNYRHNYRWLTEYRWREGNKSWWHQQKLQLKCYNLYPLPSTLQMLFPIPSAYQLLVLHFTASFALGLSGKGVVMKIFPIFLGHFVTCNIGQVWGD